MRTVDHEEEPSAEIWMLGEVVDVEPSLTEFLGVPVGTQLCRSDSDAPWVKIGTSKSKQTGSAFADDLGFQRFVQFSSDVGPGLSPQQ